MEQHSVATVSVVAYATVRWIIQRQAATFDLKDVEVMINDSTQWFMGVKLLLSWYSDTHGHTLGLIQYTHIKFSKSEYLTWNFTLTHPQTAVSAAHTPPRRSIWRNTPHINTNNDNLGTDMDTGNELKSAIEQNLFIRTGWTAIPHNYNLTRNLKKPQNCFLQILVAPVILCKENFLIK